MSENEGLDREFIIDMVGLVAGVVIFILFSILLGNYETTRIQQIEAGETLMATNGYFLIPVFVGLITFATVVIIRGIFTIGGVILESSTQEQIRG